MTTRLILLLGAAALGLVGCGGGGGGGGGDGSPVANRLTGTVATGAPMAKAQVVVKDKNGKEATATTGGDGRYEVNIADMAAPFIAQAIAQAKSSVDGQPPTYYALLRAVPDSHVLNITQTTDAVARNAGIDSAEVFKTPAQLDDKTKVDFDEVKRVAKRLASALKNYFEAVGLKSTSGETLDVTTTKFAADKVDPVDRLLECLSYDAATGTLTVKSFCSGAAAATVDLKTPTPAPLPAPSAAGAETLDYVKTNGPLIDKMVQRLSDAMSGESAAELRKVSEESLSDDFLDAWDSKGDDAATVNNRKKRLDRRDKLFNEGRRLAFATGNIVGADKSSRTIDMCITVTGSSARDGETGIVLAGFTMHMNDSGAWQVADIFQDDRCGAPKIPKGKVRLQAIVARSVDNPKGPDTPSIKATRITGGYRMCVGRVSDGLPVSDEEVPVDHEHCSEPNELERIIDVSHWKPGPTEPQVKLMVYFGKAENNKLTVANVVSSGRVNAFAINAFGNVRHNDQEVCIEAPPKPEGSGPRSNSECKPAPGVQ